MSNLLNAMKVKLNHLKQNVMLRTVLISGFALLLIFSITLAWYINNLGMWGVEFNTGNIDFNAYVFDESGAHLFGPVSTKDENESQYVNAPLITIQNAQVGSTGTAYIAVESTGSIGIQFKLAFDVRGNNEATTAYLGGYKYTVTNVTDKVVFNGANPLDVTRCPRPSSISEEFVTIDRNAVNGQISEKNGYEIYRFDYALVNKNEEYTQNSLNIYFNIFATQIGGDFESVEERGNIYYCATREDIDRAKVEAYPGDTIKLTSDIIYYGDLAINKPINLETNDFSLTVNGNLIYDYVLGNKLKIDAGGLGKIVVQCTNEGVGGNFKIKAPLSDVTLSGANKSNGDFIVEKNITFDATNAFGSPGVSFNNVRIVDEKNSRKTILLESNTRATVSFGTTIGLIQSVAKANNIEIVNNGVIGNINLSNMELLPQTNSPQIYILNNNDIDSPIMLPKWSEKFETSLNGTCTGNTRIIQSQSGSPMEITGNCKFSNSDIEIEKIDFLVEQIIEGDDSRLKIYYQDLDGQTTTIQSILENYLNNEATTGCTIQQVQQLEIISIGDKAITNADITFLNGNTMLALKYLDMQRAHMYDANTGKYGRLPNSAFAKVSKYENLILPQDLVEIGAEAFANSRINNSIVIPSGVTVFGKNWFYNGLYVSFAASVPIEDAATGITGVKAVFVDEPYIQSYKQVYSSYATKIYPTSVLDESKRHFVRNTANDNWEITYNIGGEDPVIGKNVTIDGVVLKITSVYDNAYRYNYDGTAVKFADTVQHLGAGNFTGNSNIVSVDFNNLKTVGDEAFYNCIGITSINFGKSLETIGVRTFMGCKSLNQRVELADTMKSIDASAFQETPITYVHTGGATSVGGRAFYRCTSLIQAELPKVESVAVETVNEVFYNCTSLVSVSIPSVTKVGGDKMFAYCTSLRELYMAATADGLEFGTYTFDRCPMSKLKLFVPEDRLEYFRTNRPAGFPLQMIFPMGEKMGEQLINGFNIGNYIVFSNGDDTYTLSTSNIDYVETLNVPQTYNSKAITRIFDYAFANQNFTEVSMVLGNKVQTIGVGAFKSRGGLLKVDFGKSVQVIGESAFEGCSNLSQVVELPASMRTICASAFRESGITGLKTGGTTTVESRAFYSCGALLYAEMPEVTLVAEDGVNQTFRFCNSLVSVSMPKVGLVYGQMMFRGCPALSEIYMGSKETKVSLGDYTFDDAVGASVKVYVPAELVDFYRGRGIVPAKQVYPNGEKYGEKSVNGVLLGDYVLRENPTGYTLVTSNLDYSGSASLPTYYKNRPITEIGNYAFSVQKFTNVHLDVGSQVETIGFGAFYNLTGLTSITMDGVTTIADQAFYQSGLQVLNAPKVTDLGAGACYRCTSLTTVMLPKIENISNRDVFNGCTSLKSIYFENIMSVNGLALKSCTKLESITINKQITGDGSNMPSEMTIEASAPCKIYVPYHSLSAYPSIWSGKQVVSFDATAVYGTHTYILREYTPGKHTIIDFIPSKSVTSLTLPSTVSLTGGGNATIYSIESNAFAALDKKLTSITLPASLIQLGSGALSECLVLQTISVNSGNPYFSSVNGVLYSKDGKILMKYPTGRTGSFDMTAAAYQSTVAISDSAFENAAQLTQIVFPSALTVVDSTAFKNCTGLKTVQFTGTTPPTLMGAGTFDIAVDSFQVIIPAGTNVLNAYLSAPNFADYEPYIVQK